MLKFTIRELFLLTLAAAFACGWFVSERRARSELRAATIQSRIKLRSAALGRKEAESRVGELWQDAYTWENRADVLRNELERNDWTIDWRPGAVYVKQPGKEVGDIYDYELAACGGG
jgi:hypothetical protein